MEKILGEIILKSQAMYIIASYGYKICVYIYNIHARMCVCILYI